MIRSFKDRDAERRFLGYQVRAGWQNVQDTVERKLLYLHAAVSLDDLRSPPGNRLEPLRGDRAGQHSIRVNDQWRICFVWTAAGPRDVEVVDDH